VLEVDYLVVGAGAAGMAFTDALIDHADVSVALVDRRHAPGGHWLDAYPFVRLHQASSFYGVPSTLLGGGRIQQDGPEAGWYERATAPEICAYYGAVLRDRMLPSGKVTFHPASEYDGHGTLVSRVSGRRTEVRARTVVDAHYLAPEIPSQTPPPFGVAEGVRVVPVNELPRVESAPSQYVVVGAGKTATDSIVWLLANGVDPGAIRWVRPRDPWMLNRALIQPDPAVFIGMAADTFAAAASASTPDEFLLAMEDAGVMLRIDRTVTPTMAKAPTLGQWELDLLRSIEDVVRLGHITHVEPGRMVLERGEVPIARDALVVHCAASGLQYSPLVPIWAPGRITLQPVRAGFPCFGAALIGYVEATVADLAEKNALCPPSHYGNTPASWAAMQLLGMQASAAFNSNDAVRDWAERTCLNPARVPPERAGDPDVAASRQRLRDHVEPAMKALAVLAGMA
jgi:hypothetical protein